ncbi:hypothetical protein [Diaminobutyricimonas sp. TR449]|uniref:hypothetical protein n=1 Tax=Diaminobutyricimonas sp. TR449 TaxID=2708076 RepID=UPI001421AE71|nr:hypothetical protein [Diaminobutyricimonas sp. TR449]
MLDVFAWAVIITAVVVAFIVAFTRDRAEQAEQARPDAKPRPYRDVTDFGYGGATGQIGHPGGDVGMGDGGNT